MNDWYFFVLQAVVGNLRASRNQWRVFLYLVVVVTNDRDTSRVGGLTEKNIFACIFRL